MEGEPGLYLVGYHFQHAFTSTMIHGVGRDAARMVAAINARLAKRGVAPSRGTSAHAARAEVAQANAS